MNDDKESKLRSFIFFKAAPERGGYNVVYPFSIFVGTEEILLTEKAASIFTIMATFSFNF